MLIRCPRRYDTTRRQTAGRLRIAHAKPATPKKGTRLPIRNHGTQPFASDRNPVRFLPRQPPARGTALLEAPSERPIRRPGAKCQSGEPNVSSQLVFCVGQQAALLKDQFKVLNWVGSGTTAFEHQAGNADIRSIAENGPLRTFSLLSVNGNMRPSCRS
jgi:hypothetical protein